MKKRVVSCLISLVLLISLCACSFGGDKPVAVVNGEKISSSVYQYFLYNLKAQIGGAQTVDGMPAAEYASKLALDAAVKLYVTAQKADSLDITFTDDMQKQLDEQISTFKLQAGSDEKYVEALSQYGLAEKDYELLLKYTILQDSVKEKVTSEYSAEEINDFYNNEMVNVQNILFKTVDDANMPLAEDVIKEKKALAETVLGRINSGESFAALKSQYNEDIANTELGYMVSQHSNFVEPFIKASMALEVDNVSEIVESTYGYHIIKRFNHVDNGEMFTSAQTDILSCLFERDVNLWTQASEIEYFDDVIDSIEY